MTDGYDGLVAPDAEQGREREHELRVRVTVLATVVAATAVVATMWWSADPINVGAVIAVVVAGGVLAASVQVSALARVWDVVGPVVGTVLVALLVRFTGGADSNYQDLFLVVPLTSALTLGLWRFAASIVLAAMGALTPVIYEPVDASFVADAVADAAVWLAATVVVFAQVRRLRAQEAELRQANELKTAFLQATSHELRSVDGDPRGGADLRSERSAANRPAT